MVLFTMGHYEEGCGVYKSVLRRGLKVRFNGCGLECWCALPDWWDRLCEIIEDFEDNSLGGLFGLEGWSSWTFLLVGFFVWYSGSTWGFRSLSAPCTFGGPPLMLWCWNRWLCEGCHYSSGSCEWSWDRN